RPRAVTVVLPPAPRVGPPRVEPEPWARSVELVAPAERAGPAVLVERVVRVERPPTRRPARLGPARVVDPRRLVATPALRRAVRRRVVPQLAQCSRVALPAAMAILPAETPEPAPVAGLGLRVGRVVPVLAELVGP